MLTLEVETEKMNHVKKERDHRYDTTVLDIQGPSCTRLTILDENGTILYQKGSIQYDGEVWSGHERKVVTLQTTTPMTEWGNWDCARCTSMSTTGPETMAPCRVGSTRMNSS